MSRYGHHGRFVDGSVIRRRMAQKDARVNREIAQRQRVREATPAQLAGAYGDVIREGRAAFEAGAKFLDACPYDLFSIEFQMFRSGWRHAAKDAGE